MKQILSFIPVKVSFNDSLYQKITVDKTIDFETDMPRITCKLKLWGMRKQFDYNLDKLNDNNFEVYFNLDYSKYTMFILGFICCILGILISVFRIEPPGYLTSMLLFLTILIQSLFNSLHLGIKEIVTNK